MNIQKRRISAALLAALAAGFAYIGGTTLSANAQDIPTIGCYADGSIFNTAAPNWDSSPYWTIKRTTDNVPGPAANYMATSYRDTAAYPPPPGPWEPTFLVSTPNGGWVESEYNAKWIAHSSTGQHVEELGGGLYQLEEFYYRFVFNMDPSVDLASFNPRMKFYADDSVYDIYINNERIQPSPWVVQHGADINPWTVQSFLTGQEAEATLTGNWQYGTNEVVVHIRSIGDYQGFLAEFQQGPLCTPKLTLRKVVNGGNLTENDFTLSASGPVSLSGKTGDPAITAATVEPGTYTLSETPSPEQAGYVQSISCTITTVQEDGSSSTSTTTGPTVNLTPYDSADCVITNEVIPPTQLTLKKTVQNTKLGTLGPESFTLRAVGQMSISGIDGAPAITNAVMEPGTYQLSEDPVDGYSATGPFVCIDARGGSVPVSAGNEIQIGRGQNVTCTVTNVDSGAELTLNKVVINDSGGTASEADFSLVATGEAGARAFSHGETIMLAPGSYTLSEEGPAGYGASLYSCVVNGGAPVSSNSITLQDDDVAICTVTNNDIGVEKALTGESGQLPDVAEPGEIFTYTVTLFNDGEAEALYNLVDDLDPNLTYVPGSAAGAAAGMEPVSTRPLRWDGLTIPPQGTITVSYQTQVANPLPAGVSSITNCVGNVCSETASAGTVSATKKLIGEAGGIHLDLAEPGEVLTYEVTLTNEGAAPALYDLGDVPDQHSTYVANSTRGTAGVGEPEGPLPLIWRGIQVNPGAPITVIYDMKVADVLPAGMESLRNIAYSPQAFEDESDESGGSGGDTPRYPGPDFCVANPESCVEAETFNVSFTKIAHVKNAVRGMLLPFTIQLTNNASAPVRDMMITDTMPAGFRFVEGSATIDGAPTVPVQNGRELQFTVPQLEPKSTTNINLQIQALPTLKPGQYSNRASLRDKNGREAAAGASAPFEITIETYFDCGEIIGRVFDDKNRNGYHDEGERGVAGARVTAVQGITVSTDDHGRFSVACADIPEARVGSNFLMKLDPRSLPSGYRILSENPRTVRLTAGKMSSIDFATSIARVVRLDLNSAAFFPATTELLPQWHQGLDDLIRMLAAEPSVLRISIEENSEGRSLATKRLEAMRALITELWGQSNDRYRLEIEARILFFGRHNKPDADRAFLIVESEQ